VDGAASGLEQVLTRKLHSQAAVVARRYGLASLREE
jgi:hypothetical protein